VQKLPVASHHKKITPNMEGLILSVIDRMPPSSRSTPFFTYLNVNLACLGSFSARRWILKEGRVWRIARSHRFDDFHIWNALCDTHYSLMAQEHRSTAVNHNQAVEGLFNYMW